MNQTTDDFEECKQAVYKTLDECEAYAAWSGHEYAVEYLQQEYDCMMKFAAKYELDVSDLAAAYRASELYIDTIFNKLKVSPNYDQTKELNRLDGKFVDCMYETARYFEDFIGRNEQ